MEANGGPAAAGRHLADDDLDPLELLDFGVAGRRHRLAQAPGGSSCRRGPRTGQAGCAPDHRPWRTGHARRVAAFRASLGPPMETATGRFLRPGQRRADHDRIGAAGEIAMAISPECTTERTAMTWTATSSSRVVAPRSSDVGDRRGHRYRDPQHGPTGVCGAASNPTNTPAAPVRIRCKAAWYVAQPPTMTGASSS